MRAAPVRALLLALLLALGSLVPAAASGPRPAARAVSQSDSTGAIPRQQIVRRSLRSNPSQEYLLYLPRSSSVGAPVFVTAHGISRNVEEHAALFAPFAEQHGVVLVAPAFTEQGNDDYQRLGRAGRGSRSDVALEDILDEVQRLTGAATGKFCLFGYSGGAQFAHRFTLAHPDRIERAIIGAAGWYLFPDSGTPYPYGLGASAELPDLRFDPDRFLRVPILVVVGGADTGSKNLRQGADLDRQQGTTRVERAERWAQAMRREAQARGLEPRVSCVQVPGIGHSFGQLMREGGLGERVFGFMFGSAAHATSSSARGGP